jgi:hypothetical protein
MENDKPPFVAVIGGLYKLTSDDAKAEAKNPPQKSELHLPMPA